MYQLKYPNRIEHPENLPFALVVMNFEIDHRWFGGSTPVQYRWVDPVEGEHYRPIELVPPIALNLDQKVCVFPDAEEKTISVRLHCNEESVAGKVEFQVPAEWNVI